MERKEGDHQSFFSHLSLHHSHFFSTRNYSEQVERRNGVTISNGCLQLMKWLNHEPLHTVLKETPRAISLVSSITKTAHSYRNVAEEMKYFLVSSCMSLFFLLLWIIGRSNILVTDTLHLKLAQPPLQTDG